MTAEFITSLIAVRDWNHQLAQIREWAAAGRLGLLRDIAEVVSGSSCPADVEPMVRLSMFEGILHSLAMIPSEANAEAALLCSPLSEKFGHPYRQARPEAHLASLLGERQPHATLEPLFRRYGGDGQHRELLACLVQETLLRTGEVPAAAVEFHEQRVVASAHPLARLPLRLLPSEQLLPRYLPVHGPSGGSSWGLAHPSDLLAAQHKPEPPGATGLGWTPLLVSDENQTAACSAVQNWIDQSNGIAEVGVFELERLTGTADLSERFLASLPLKCFDGATSIVAKVVPPAEPLAHLFSAASTGGAYNSGLHGAYGRLAAWRSVAAIMDVDDDAPIEAVSSAAENCDWMVFGSNSPWFCDVAWDLGVILIRPDRRTMVVLAATDTD